MIHTLFKRRIIQNFSRVDMFTQSCADHKMAQKPQGLQLRLQNFVFATLCVHMYVAFLWQASR